MPLYEYRCEKCTYQFTTHQSLNDDPLEFCGIHCPIQDIGQLKKLISRVNFILKGAGFHQNDYKKEERRK
jgi:putative FmdB family regulatory protein